MTASVLVFIGAGFGGLMRHLVSVLGVRLFGVMEFPAVTLLINVLGCFIMGILTVLFAQRMGDSWFWSQHARLMLTTGMLGGFTTFSTFSLEFAVLFERGFLWQAAAYAAGSLVLCLIAVFAGLSFIRAMT